MLVGSFNPGRGGRPLQRGDLSILFRYGKDLEMYVCIDMNHNENAIE